MKISLIAVLTAITALLTLSSTATAQKITKAQLPTAVASAFDKAYPSATLKGVSREPKKHNGKVCYEIESMDNSMTRDIIYAADGEVVEIEEGIAAASLPMAVSDGVRKHFPNEPVEKAEKLTRGGVVQYELVLTAGKKHKEVVLDEKGNVVKGL
jgi:Putative beta-lactamase-inhibitor-like, PepSY-like